MLGLNLIAEVGVNTLSYFVDQGRYGTSQVNCVTKSGTNKTRKHGNLYELETFNLNAADYFTKNAIPSKHKPRATVNHFGGSPWVGRSFMTNCFSFFDSDWVRIAYRF